jgi:hypothetical protein
MKRLVRTTGNLDKDTCNTSETLIFYLSERNSEHRYFREVVAYLKVLSKYIPGGTEESHVNSQ